MPFTSSPVAYPPSSSPPPVIEKRKREEQPDQIHLKRRVLSRELNPLDGNAEIRVPSLHFSAKFLPEDKENHLKPAFVTRGPFADDGDDDDHNGPRNTSLRADSLDNEFAQFEAALEVNVRIPALSKDSPRIKTSSGRTFSISQKKDVSPFRYDQFIANWPVPGNGKATKSFYGVDIHSLIDQAAKESTCIKERKLGASATAPLPSIETPSVVNPSRKGRTMLWTEKYRARKFTDLVGDERTHRDVLRWIKGWDEIVFPDSNKPRPTRKFAEQEAEPRPQSKILLLTGPPGLGKTTLAHVCARQAGYEVMEINASDERSKEVVKGRIRDCVGTENVKGINTKGAAGTTRKAGRPICVVVDEVDGVVSGSGGTGEGGFIKALIDLAALDAKNSNVLGATSGISARSKKKGDHFRLLRPIILICNDVYHPALRPLRASTMAEVIHIRKPPLEKVVARLKSVFDKEGLPCENDGVRRLCEATWGISKRKENRSRTTGAGEGDMRGILVVGEWAAAKMRASTDISARLTKGWVEEHMIDTLAHGGGGTRSLGRGGAKETMERVFLDGAGFPNTEDTPVVDVLSDAVNGKTMGVSEVAKRSAMEKLREMVDTSGEPDRIMTDCFTAYPAHSWQDDTLLSKPNEAYEWLHFHDRLFSKIHIGQEWELNPYLSQPICGFHYIFASPAKQSWIGDQNRWDDHEEETLPFSGPRADFAASEALKQNKAVLIALQSSLSIPLLRSFRSAEDLSVDLLPRLIKMLTPDVKPIVVGGSGDQRGIVSVRKEREREMIQRAVNVMGAVGVTFEKARIESGQSGVINHIYRMEP